MDSNINLNRKLQEANWFPVDLDIKRGNVHFLEINEQQVEAATFMDNRFDIDWSKAERVPIDLVEVKIPVSESPVWLWHTSFCGSTLLARMLHLRPHTVSLREPLLLRRLSDARDCGLGIVQYLPIANALLSRPWHAGGRVLIKPTHAALNIANDMMTRASAGRALMLTSSLEDFILSHFKKMPETLERVSVLCGRALRASNFSKRLTQSALAPPNVFCGCALQWAAQQELIADLVASVGKSRIRVIDFDDFIFSPEETLVSLLEWLGWQQWEGALREQMRSLLARHAKIPSRQYDRGIRDAEKRYLLGQYRRELKATMNWAQQYLIPAMRFEAIQPS